MRSILERMESRVNSAQDSAAAMARWYLIHTKAVNESVAQTHLQRQGYEIYLPLVRQPVKRGVLWRERVGPLFPRYLFLRLNHGLQSLKPVHSTVGVAGIVRFGANFAVVPDQVILNLRARADRESGLLHLVDPDALRPGDMVRIAGGPFDGLEGVFQRRAGSDRVMVLLNILGQDAQARVSIDTIAPKRAA